MICDKILVLWQHWKETCLQLLIITLQNIFYWTIAKQNMYFMHTIMTTDCHSESRCSWLKHDILWGRGRGVVLHQIFSSQVQHAKINWTQSDLRFCENEESKRSTTNEKGDQLHCKSRSKFIQNALNLLNSTIWW